MTKPRETFHFNPPVEIKEDWMIGLTDLEVYNSNFNITEEINKFEHYTGSLYEEFSYTTLKNKIAEVLRLADNSTEDLEDKIHGPDINKFYRN